tara:strand:- start:150 stop:323 length:174 start_codon:yes stop_codon:yes gene_type:complete
MDSKMKNDLNIFNAINVGSIFAGITLANVEMILSVVVLVTALIYNIIKIKNIYKTKK